MTTNAMNVNADRAIMRGLVLIQGMMALAEADNNDKHILSLYAEGEPGVGKSTIFRTMADELNYKFVDRRANMMNPDDAAGSRMQDIETRETVWFPPEWMPAEDGTVEGLNRHGKPYAGTLLLFDELASADDRVRKPLFGVFLDRNINGRKLPRNCIVAAAGNEAETGTTVFELDNATRTRFITLRIVADFDSWQGGFAPAAGITPTTISYLKQNMGRFCETEKALDDGRALYGNPRSWEHVSTAERAIMRTPEDRKDEDKQDALEMAVSGKVGRELAMEFMGVFKSVADMTNLYDIMKATKEKRRELWPKSIGQLYALAYSMMSYPSNVEMGKTIMDLMEEMPKKNERGAEVPFEEMKAPIREMILKRLKAGGIKEPELIRAFGDGSKASVEDILANGPLIRISGK